MDELTKNLLSLITPVRQFYFKFGLPAGYVHTRNPAPGEDARRRTICRALNDCPPFFPLDGYITVYRGMSREEARHIIAGKIDCGWYFTAIRDMAASYAGKDKKEGGTVLEVTIPLSAIKYATKCNDGVHELIVAPGEAFCEGPPMRFYKVRRAPYLFWRIKKRLRKTLVYPPFFFFDDWEMNTRKQLICYGESYDISRSVRHGGRYCSRPGAGTIGG